MLRPRRKKRRRRAAETAIALIEEAKKPEANKSLLKILGDGFKSAAAAVEKKLPGTVDTATKIVTLIGKVQGLG